MKQKQSPDQEHQRQVRKKLDRIAALLERLVIVVEEATCRLNNLQQKGDTIMTDLTQLKDEVAQTKGVQQSAIVLIQGLAAKIAELAAGVSDPALQAEIQALATDLLTARTELAAKVAENPVP